MGFHSFVIALYGWLNKNGLLASLATAVATIVYGATAQRLGKPDKRMSWAVLYDEPINQEGSANSTPWEISFQSRDPGAVLHEVENGSLVVMEMRNAGRQTIREADFGERREFVIRFPGREVMNFKVRDNDLYHEQVQARPAVTPGLDSFRLPALQIDPGKSFKLMVLLGSPGGGVTPLNYPKPEILGSIADGSFAEASQGRVLRRRRWIIPAAAIALIAIVVSFVGGIGVANRALAPAATCGTGKLEFDGSTAFAPIINEVATEYEQQCQDAQITVRGVGSAAGLKNLEDSTSDSPVIAMSDGKQQGGASFRAIPVGVIIFAVVGNRSLPATTFENGIGLTKVDIATAFDEPGAQYRPVGRSSGSGTREAFHQNVLFDDKAENTAPQCQPAGAPPANPPAGLCLEDTTLGLLNYVNATDNAIGYAEADALPFFPNVGAIPINGREPSRANALNGKYAFLATEYLYVKGTPTGLVADLINFLKSGPVIAQLRDTSFISCSDLARSQISDACTNG
jgi:ABC-type phosphate transport system substrate-binding protein